MGCDIHGYVEVDIANNNDYEWWYDAGNLITFVGRSYDSFGLLFGVRNYVGFDSLFHNRGIPENASRTVESEYEYMGTAHSPSHVTYDELIDVDWGVKSPKLDTRYSVLNEDKEPTGLKMAIGPGSNWYTLVSENRDAIDRGEAVPNEEGDKYIQRRQMSREQALSGAWKWVIHDYMSLLADRFGETKVRLVVWFDN